MTPPYIYGVVIKVYFQYCLLKFKEPLSYSSLQIMSNVHFLIQRGFIFKKATFAQFTFLIPTLGYQINVQDGIKRAGWKIGQNLQVLGI